MFSVSGNVVRILVAALFLVLASGSIGSAEERILLFDSKVEIQPDASLVVKETIRVQAENRNIRRGIFRDFPLQFEGANGRLRSNGFEVISVTRNGSPEKYRVEKNRKIARVYIGQRNVILDPGVYTYEINYTTDRQIRYFEKDDELFWNVTGNAWAFPIDAAVAEITLPANSTILNTVSYTGPYGSQENNATSSLSADRRSATFRTTSSLKQFEGLTVGIKFPKGVVTQPSQADEWRYWLRENLGLALLFAGGLIVLVYYLIAWVSVGRDPPAGVVVPRWEPPEGVSPALANYIDRKGLSGGGWSAIASGILSLAVKGFVELRDVTSSTTLIAASDSRSSGSLPVGEAAIWSAIKGNGGELNLNKSDGIKVQSMQRKFSAAMEREHRSAYYVRNRLWVVGGVVLSALTLLVTALFGQLDENELGLMFVFGVFAVIASVVLSAVVRNFSSGLGGKISAVWTFGILGFMAFQFLGGFISSALDDRLPYIIGGVLSLAVINGVFYFLMGAPTPLGRKMMDGLEGLKTYIRLAESDRMNLKGAPSMSPEHYETLLPYAVALKLEKPWTNAFQNWLLTAAAAGAAATASYYGPRWYHGDDFTPDRLDQTIGNVANSLEDSMAASIPAPKSSSSGFSGGGGGGGFSGGGGGGGGGGGW